MVAIKAGGRQNSPCPGAYLSLSLILILIKKSLSDKPPSVVKAKKATVTK
jgi:hypothetical protein